MPLTGETEGLLDAAAFACMPRGGYVINVARGAHIVEADLIAAVRSGHLAGAALDVQCREPLPADDPLWSVPGITITPHIAAQSSTEVIATSSSRALRALQRGEPVPNESIGPRLLTRRSARVAGRLDALRPAEGLHRSMARAEGAGSRCRA